MCVPSGTLTKPEALCQAREIAFSGKRVPGGVHPVPASHQGDARGGLSFLSQKAIANEAYSHLL